MHNETYQNFQQLASLISNSFNQYIYTYIQLQNIKPDIYCNYFMYLCIIYCFFPLNFQQHIAFKLLKNSRYFQKFSKDIYIYMTGIICHVGYESPKNN